MPETHYRLGGDVSERNALARAPRGVVVVDDQQPRRPGRLIEEGKRRARGSVAIIVVERDIYERLTSAGGRESEGEHDGGF